MQAGSTFERLHFWKLRNRTENCSGLTSGWECLTSIFCPIFHAEVEKEKATVPFSRWSGHRRFVRKRSCWESGRLLTELAACWKSLTFLSPRPLPVRHTLLDSDKRAGESQYCQATLFRSVCVWLEFTCCNYRNKKAFSTSDWLGPQEPWTLWLGTRGQTVALWQWIIFQIPNISNSPMIEGMTNQDKWCSKPATSFSCNH